MNYTVQDIVSILAATFLFPMVSIFPGYVIGWATDIFLFRKRTLIFQYVAAIALSNALLPVLLFILYRFLSWKVGIGLIFVFLFLWGTIQARYLSNHPFRAGFNPKLKTIFIIGGIWVLFCTLLLADIQIGNRLYFNAAAYDYTTRVTLIEAISQAGIPPINLSFYPGHLEKITELYYFWYIGSSAIDVIGSSWVNARDTLFAGIIWNGLSLMATIAMYLRIRNEQKNNIWKTSVFGIKVLAISGLDFVPVLSIMIAVKSITGMLPYNAQIEGWNMPIMSWLNAITWVPNHVAGMAACMVALVAIISGFEGAVSDKTRAILIAGLSIGSAFGLSTWVAVVFGVFMGIWSIFLLSQKEKRNLLIMILISGIVGIVLASKFLLEVLQSGGKSGITGQSPIALYVRDFSFSYLLPSGIQEFFELLFLPVNYFMELGFFFLILVIWLKNIKSTGFWKNNIYFQAEILAITVIILLMTFVKSTVIFINDLGIRGWLPAQFILVIWATDVINNRQIKSSSLGSEFHESKKTNSLIQLTLIVGFMTTCLEAGTTRFWTPLVDIGVVGTPNQLTPDTSLGFRTFSARMAYEYISDNVPQTAIIQNDPIVILDRPSGLYGSQQMVISDRTAYGIPIEIYKKYKTAIKPIFQNKDNNWDDIDNICKNYFIQIIVVSDADPVWKNLPELIALREPIYKNNNYALFNCGNK